MKHVVSLSGGTASAVTADRVIERYGPENTTLWFADTNWEDEDLYRFLEDLEAYWGMVIVRYKDGRTPLEVAEEHKIIPNNGLAPCSFELKVKPFRQFIEQRPKPITVHLGMDFTEQHRMITPKAKYEEIAGVTVDYPLMWEPVARPPHRKVTESWGIETPQLYRLGFPHNNCGGRCVKQGIKEWQRLKQTHPQRFDEVASWEQAQREGGGPKANFSIMKDRTGGDAKALPLYELGERKGEQLLLGASNEDIIGCFCEY